MEIIRRGKDIILNPKAHQRTLIWLHGLGDSAEGFLPLFQTHHLITSCRVSRFTAPYRPATLNYGQKMNSWYDIISINKREMNSEVTESAEIVTDEIIKQREETDTLFLGGFSQGGALSLYTGLAYIDKLVTGIIGTSCYAMNYLIKNHLKNTPVLLYHGLNDMMVTKDLAENSYKTVLKDIKYILLTEPNLGHGLSLKALDEIKAWVNALIKV